MSRPGILLSALALALALAILPRSQRALADDQTATATLNVNELADALGVRWWAVRIPDDFPASSSVGVEWVTGDGKGITKMTGLSTTMSNISIAGGAIVKIFLRDQPGGPEITIVSPGGDSSTDDPGIPSLLSTCHCQRGIGTFANSGDILIKLVKRGPDGSASMKPGNDLNPGDIGLRVNIKAGPRTAAAK